MKIPKIAIGTGGLMKGNGDISEMLTAAKESGIVHIDTAHIYENELEVGLELEKLEWSDLFLTTKVNPINMKYHTEVSVNESINFLKRTPDLVLLHGPVNNEVNTIAFKKLIEIRNKGLIKNIGVSNFTIEQLKYLHESTGVWPVNNQIYITPTYFDKKLINFCKSQNIEVSAFSSIGSYYRENESFTMSNEEKAYIDELANKYNKTPANIIFRWLLDQEINIVFQSRKPERIRDNLNIQDFNLTIDEIDKINSFDRGIRKQMMPTYNEEQLLAGKLNKNIKT